MRRQQTRRIVALAAGILAISVSVFGQTTQTQVGADAAAQLTSSGPVKRLSIDEAVRSALEQNLGIQAERLNPQVQDLAISQARSFWTPTVSSTVSRNSNNQPATSLLAGAAGKLTSNRFSTDVSANQLLPWGGNYSLSWDSARSETNSFFSGFNPALSSTINAQYQQPLLRNFKIDTVRQQLLLSHKNREIADVQLHQTIVQTTHSVKTAYWDLSYAINSLAVQRQSLDLARESLRNNRSRVEIGTMAPIDIIEAEAEVAQREEAVILAEAAITQAEDRLRALIMDPRSPDFWTVKLEPTDMAAFQAQAIDVDAAVRSALEKRTDIQQARKNLESSDINIRYFRNQSLPDVNAQVNYGLTGQGGIQFQRGPGVGLTPGPILGQTERTFGSVLGDLFRNNFPAWTVALTVGYPIGTSNAEANLARAKLQHTQAQTQIRNLELQVVTQVRDVARQVSTNAKRVQSTRKSRELAERRLQAEEKKFAAGMSTTFFVLQAQRDLSLARNNELRAVLDYDKSLADFDAVQETSIAGGLAISTPVSGSLTSGTSGATTTTSAATSSAVSTRP